MESKLEKLNTKLITFFNLQEFENKGVVFVYSLLILNLWFSVENKYNLLKDKVIELPCSPLIQWCKPVQDFLFLNYYLDFRPIFFTFLLITFTFSIIFLLQRKHGLSFLAFFMTAILSFIPMFIFSNNYGPLNHHQDNYLFWVLLIFLLAKKDRIQLLIIFYFLSYFYSSIPKFTSEFWLLGIFDLSYINYTLSPFFTNLIILSQIIMPFFLLFGKRYMRTLVLIFFEIFHLYTVTLPGVKYTFFWIVVPMLFLLFYEYFEKPKLKDLKDNKLVFATLMLFSFLSLFRLVIPGDDSITKEGSSYGINLFNTVYKTTAKYEDADMKKVIDENIKISNYFEYLQKIQQNCIDDKQRSLNISLTSVYNYYKVVSEINYCKLTYNPWWHNNWIGKMYYEEDLSKLNKTQLFFYNIKKELELGYYVLFIFMGILIIKKFFFEPESK